MVSMVVIVIVNDAMMIVADDLAKDNRVYLPSPPKEVVFLLEDFQGLILTAVLLMCQLRRTVLAGDQHHQSQLQLHPSVVQG
jgi:hypothetical protein